MSGILFKRIFTEQVPGGGGGVLITMWGVEVGTCVITRFNPFVWLGGSHYPCGTHALHGKYIPDQLKLILHSLALGKYSIGIRSLL